LAQHYFVKGVKKFLEVKLNDSMNTLKHFNNILKYLQSSSKLSVNAFELPISYNYPIPSEVLKNIKESIGYLTVNFAAINITVQTIKDSCNSYCIIA
jgi:hypothetical protein